MSLPFKKCDIPRLSSAEYLAFYDKEWTALKSKEIISKVSKKIHENLTAFNQPY